jgi:hypothetical protein
MAFLLENLGDYHTRGGGVPAAKTADPSRATYPASATFHFLLQIFAMIVSDDNTD